MGKVEMSLQDYDNLKSELALYEEIVNAITNPIVSDWNLNWYNDHPGSSLEISSDSIMNNLSKTAKEFLKSLIQIHVDNYLRDKEIEGTFKFNPSDIEFKLGSINHNEESKIESREEK